MALTSFCSYCGAENIPGNACCHACQESLDTPFDDLETATLLNERYEILIEVGAGGFGAVYKARDTQEHARLVAVKQINLKGLSAQEIIEATDAFNREAQILSTLSHPLLPHIFDRFSDPEHWYLVMNFIDGRTLDDYLQQHIVSSLPDRSGLSLSETLAISLQLCDVLHYLHTQQPPVIFRDLKPGNIMRTTNGHLYLIDFGIARRFKPGQAKDTVPFGSPGFASPEQYGRAQTTPQADIYSLGALLYCLISGDDPSEHPFQFPSLRLYGIDGIRELDTLIQDMVALNPEQRPSDIQAVRAKILSIQQMHDQANQQSHIWLPPPGQTPPPSPAVGSGQQHIFLAPSNAQQQTGLKTTRRRVLTGVLIVGGVTLFGGIIATQANQRFQTNPVPYGSVNQGQFDTASQTASAQGTESTTTVDNQATAQNPTFWSPDLTHKAVINPDKNGIELYTNQGNQLLKTIQPTNFDSYATVQWSPDNQQIIIFTANDAGDVWDINGGRQIFTLPSTILASSSGGPTISAWSPNGHYLASGYLDLSGTSVFALFSTTTGKLLFQKTFSTRAITSIAWTPDGKYIFLPVAGPFTTGLSSTWTLEIWNSQTHQKAGVIEDPHAKLDANVDMIRGIVCSPSTNQVAFIYRSSIWVGNFKNSHTIYQLSNIPADANNALINSLLWSPDAKYLAINAQGTLGIWDFSTGQSVNLDANTSQGNISYFSWATDSKSIIVIDTNNVRSRWPVG